LKEFFARLTWVDYLAAIAFLRGCYVGYRSGFFPELLRIASYLVTVIVTFRFREETTQFLTLNTFLNATTSGFLAVAGLLAATFGLTKLLSVLILRLLKLGEGGFFARTVGLMMGAVRWMVLLSLLFMLIDHSPLVSLKNDIRDRSVSGRKIARIAPVLFDFLGSLSPQLSVPAAQSPAAKKTVPPAAKKKAA